METLTDDLVNGAVRFHGHFGPFLILGLRAGLIGINYLGKSYFELNATVSTVPNPPRSCFIDGVQYTSGCTTGKGNLAVNASNGVSVLFRRGGLSVDLKIRDGVLNALEKMKTDEEVEAFGREIMKKTDEDLFIISVSK